MVSQNCQNLLCRFFWTAEVVWELLLLKYYFSYLYFLLSYFNKKFKVNFEDDWWVWYLLRNKKWTIFTILQTNRVMMIFLWALSRSWFWIRSTTMWLHQALFGAAGTDFIRSQGKLIQSGCQGHKNLPFLTWLWVRDFCRR